jgi:cyclomaltodextrinase / maltogenic alpha-amylase / neopullulanase
MNDINPNWAQEAVFYHIYPLGLCAAPPSNDFSSPPEARLQQLHGWLDHLQSLGVNAVYLGPVFESSTHGYDTADYYWVDRRLGTNETLSELIDDMHQRGMRVILDAVLNHTGRDFWAFQDVLRNGESSAYCDWFQGLRFGESTPYQDPFTYETWAGHYELVKLNLAHPAVREHLLGAVEAWINQFEIDGLRLDAADCMEPDFLRQLAAFCRSMRPDFWLMGEIIHGDYNQWANSAMLDSVTNYECYKGLYSSHNDHNYYEIAYALNRQFGESGIYEGKNLYAFADNHDVNRVASMLINNAHLFPLYFLLFTMPGVPSIYYGSEWGLTGAKENGSDAPMRPALDLSALRQQTPIPGLVDAIARLANVRKNSRALQHGNYRQLYVNHQQIAFSRQIGNELVIVLVNASDTPVKVELEINMALGRRLIDLLDPGDQIAVNNSQLQVEAPAGWGRILRQQE